MLQLTNGTIVETLQDDQDRRSAMFSRGEERTNSMLLGNIAFVSGFGQSSNCLDGYRAPSTVYWNSYPVYVCTDKTAKSIEILKKLQSEKVIEVKSVPQFIELVEAISAIL